MDPQEGWNIPSGVLPPIGSRDLPEPVPLGKLFGASVVILATAMGSGEFVIWSYITRANFVLRGFDEVGLPLYGVLRRWRRYPRAGWILRGATLCPRIGGADPREHGSSHGS